MKTNDTIFSNKPKLAISDRLLYEGKDVSTAPYGEHWRRMRSICVLQLLSNKRVQSFRVLEWAMTRLLRHPRVLKKVQNEIMGIANSKPDIAEIDLDQMHYLKAVIKETLRLYPPIPLLAPRESTKDVKIKGYDIAARTMVLVNAWTIGRDPSLWDEPERELCSGRRGCQGQMFAMTTIVLVLANLVHKFDWALPCGARAEDMNMTEWTGLVIHRQVPLLAVPKLRPF
ncbi:hypothetical protein PRUPE_7G209500 [Prunus persica]|uniref:Cytochrome P450 n=1 Tax=Prunus persica TaxID=3760 RepID=M5VT86_PRUPE|nr:hypothetical protein PRUPE_7G209500 [Prunus persica]